jgi:HlyD family secretion protein
MDAVSGSLSLSQATANTYKANVATALTNVNTAITNISDQIQSISGEKITIRKTQDELTLKLAGTSSEEILSQEAVMQQAEAKAQGVRAQIGKTVLRSPLRGTVTKRDIQTGEIASPNTSVISVISESNLEIEANVPEVDVGKVLVGNPVRITLDAFPGENFQGKVAYIEPAETIVDGVVNFKIKIAFDASDERFKSGLTANLVIETLRKENVLVLPQFAILENDRGTFVRKQINGTVTEVPVVLGIRSQNGTIEIISGVTEGEEVLNIGSRGTGQ